MKIYEADHKSKENSLEKALLEANASVNEVFYRVKEEETGLLKKTKYKTFVLTKQDLKDEINNFFNELSKNINIKISNVVNFEENIIKIKLDSDSNSILIGRDGKTLKSIELLLKQSLFISSGFSFKINIDISDYKEKRIKNLEIQVDKIAKEVLDSKIDVKLDPMNSYERRIAHTVIAKYENLSTKSTGEDPNRYIVISYKQD